MIINTQAFASSLKEDGRSKEARIIYSKRDEFGSRRPIDVIKANRPIIILDEPQKMGGDVTQKALKNFNPLFSLNYSATHAKQHNLIYVLDALDAFNKKLVKKIEVKGFEVKISEVRTAIYTLSRLCFQARSHLWQKSSWKSDTTNP
jgi:type III restriction enzyme